MSRDTRDGHVRISQNLDESNRRTKEELDKVKTETMGRTNDLAKQVGDAKLGQMQTVKSLQDLRATALSAEKKASSTERSMEDVRNAALSAEKKADKTSASVSSLQRSHSDRLGNVESEMKALRQQMMAQNYGSDYTGMIS